MRDSTRCPNASVVSLIGSNSHTANTTQPNNYIHIFIPNDPIYKLQHPCDRRARFPNLAFRFVSEIGLNNSLRYVLLLCKTSDKSCGSTWSEDLFEAVVFCGCRILWIFCCYYYFVSLRRLDNWEIYEVTLTQ